MHLRSARPATATPGQLLVRHQPVTVLHPLEAFAPASVDAFVAGATLERPDGSGGWIAADPQPATANALPASGEWRIDYRGCTPVAGVASIACYGATQAAAPSVVYGAVRTTKDRIVLQYWYWYAYNFWSGLFPPGDYVWQAHEGDWEVIAVVLTKAGKPLYVGYSQHCSGKRRVWAKVPKRGAHPVAYVGLGSHSHWFGTGDQLMDLSCYEPAAAVVFRTYLGTVLDRTGSGRRLGPAGLAPERTALVRVTENAPRWMRYPGRWGETAWAHFPDPLGTLTYGPAPEGPAFHAIWRRPLTTMTRWPRG